MRFLVLILLVFGSAAAIAADWEVVAPIEPTGSMISLDKNSIARTGEGKRKAWFKTTYTKPQVLGDEKTKFIESVELDGFDCAERTMAMIQVVYRDSGKVVKSFDNPLSYPRYTDVVPESVGEAMLDAVCAAELPAKE